MTDILLSPIVLALDIHLVAPKGRKARFRREKNSVAVPEEPRVLRVPMEKRRVKPKRSA